MKKITKNKKKLLIIVTCILIIPLSFSRYIYSAIKNSILESNGFYFNSSILTENSSSFNIDNWDGVNSYSLTIDVNNIKNEEIYSKNNIEYNINVSCSDEITCTLSKNTGLIVSDVKTDSYIITITPLRQIRRGEHVTITTSVTSTTPYVKTLSAEYTLGVTNENFTYDIEDGAGEKYMILSLTNNVPYYKVLTAFDTYAVGDTISIDTYNELSDENKEKCYSSIVELNFDPNDILLDMANNIYINNIDFDVTTINSYDYVNNISFYMGANENKKIKFYKKDVTQNYTYPIVNNNPKVTVLVTTA